MWSGRTVSKCKETVRNLATYGIESQETPKFDAPVEVAEGNVHGNEDNIRWVAEEVAPEFDSLTENKGP
jgi:hypothetical protein